MGIRKQDKRFKNTQSHLINVLPGSVLYEDEFKQDPKIMNEILDDHTYAKLPINVNKFSDGKQTEFNTEALFQRAIQLTQSKNPDARKAGNEFLKAQHEGLPLSRTNQEKKHKKGCLPCNILHKGGKI